MSELLRVSGCDKPDRELDLIFVHGLDGNGHSTWQKDNDAANFWPGWLGEEFSNIGVWSLDYEAGSLNWKGHSMPLYDRARNCLDLFDLFELGNRPIGFVCHSLGGLLVKQMLRLASEFNQDNWKTFAEQSRFIVFLSTPHSGSDMANWVNYLGSLLRTSASVEELKAHNPSLLQLNSWYGNNVGKLKIKTYVYCESLPTKGILVVNETSANPGITGVIPVPLDRDHVSICKPANKNDPVYLRVKRCLKEMLTSKENNGVAEHIQQTDPYSGRIKLTFCDLLGNSWRDLATILEIKSSEEAQFQKGLEPRGIWEWLERQERLAELPAALDEIGRSDLAKELNRHPN